MQGVLEGFGVIGVVIALGYALARTGVLGPGAVEVLSPMVFFVGAPAQLFVTLAEADGGEVFASALVVTAASVATTAGVFAVVARLAWHRDVGETVIGAVSSSYVNAGNLGIPVAVYVLGDAAFVAPVMLVQLVVMAPLAFAVLDGAAAGHRRSPLRVVVQALRNPVTVGTLLGVAVAVSGVPVPVVVERPTGLVAGMAVPLALIAFGASLRGAPRPGAGDSLRDTALVVGLKVALQPAVAWFVGHVILGLEGTSLLAVTLTAALPTAQNVFVYAVRYQRGVPLARDAISVTTPLSALAVLVITALLA